MGGVFMGRAFKSVIICLVLVVFVWFGTVLADRQKLRQELIRIHVVANSDSSADQSRKRSVRDAVIGSIGKELQTVSDPEAARQYLQDKLPDIRQLAEKTLRALGCDAKVTVDLQKEALERTCNGLISLPAGIYESLRIIIGEGKGENWWSVIFPESVVEWAAADAGGNAAPVFSADSQKPGELEIRFYVLDMLGRMENIFFPG